MSPIAQPTFTADERVLCFHGPLIYEAKVLKVDHDKKDYGKEKLSGTLYYVHYKGWKASWDDWVPPSRLLKFDPAGLAKQKQLIEVFKQAKKVKDEGAAAKAAEKDGSAAPAAGANAVASGSGAGKKAAPGAGAAAAAAGGAGAGRKRAREGDSELDFARRPEIKFPVPDVLKVQLVDDWEYVTKNQQIVPLPRTPNVKQLLADYKADVLASVASSAKARAGESPKALAILDEVLDGLYMYFNKALGSNLLYRFERQQYLDRRREWQAGEDAKQGGEFVAGEVYGAEHLLRLFVNLPSFIAQTNMDAESVNILRDHISDFMRFMIKEQKRIFVSSYELASPHYINLSRT